jgi:hypothetical protein
MGYRILKSSTGKIEFFITGFFCFKLAGFVFFWLLNFKFYAWLANGKLVCKSKAHSQAKTKHRIHELIRGLIRKIRLKSI